MYSHTLPTGSTAPAIAAVNPPQADSFPQTRLFFLDWVRIIAFFVLIFYHVGMVYVTWDFHIKSPFASDTIEPLMMLSQPWRLALLFMISGVASSFMLKKIALGQFVRQRSRRLLLPLLFGMLVIVPPQAYLQVVETLGYQGSYPAFMALYLKAYHGFCSKGACLDLPTWNHLWFVIYLWNYTLVLVLVMWALGDRYERLAARVTHFLQGGKLIIVPIALLALVRMGLFDAFPSTHNLVRDWYNHAQFLPLFLLGAMVAQQKSFWQALNHIRWTTLALAVASWALMTVARHWPDGLVAPADEVFWRIGYRILYGTCQWGAIAAVCGFAHRHLQFDSAKRRYLSQAVFPVYILHQTLIIILAHTFKPAHLPPLLEGVILIVLTLIFSFAGFELVRRVSWLRPCFGLAQHDEIAAPKPA